MIDIPHLYVYEISSALLFTMIKSESLIEALSPKLMSIFSLTIHASTQYLYLKTDAIRHKSYYCF